MKKRQLSLSPSHTCPEDDEASSTFTLPAREETMEPAQRCVPGPGAWVDWEICLGSFFVRLRLSFFFFFQEWSRRSTSSKEFLLARFLSLPRLGLCAWERATITKKANGSTDLWEENVAWGGEGGHEKIDLQKFRMQGKGGALERAENRKKVRSCLCSLRCSASKNSKKKPDFFFFASNLQTHFRNSNHALLLQVELAPGQGRGPRARRCRAQRVHVSEGD